MERIWAGWRTEYVTSADVHDDAECVLCKVIEDGTYVVWRDDLVAVILNAFPYTSGHVMVLPIRHVGEVEDVNRDEVGAVWAAVANSVRAIKAAYRPDGLNMGANLGRVAGAGIPGHFHVHVLPRWSADTNFMTSVAEARVLPEALPATLERLQKAWPRHE
ncbi:MAG: HIT domain-containing protein [Acidimicrobiia bacterium]|nr:HIT domain-containing protein [Acidimicrobiia bacterium]